MARGRRSGAGRGPRGRRSGAGGPRGREAAAPPTARVCAQGSMYTLLSGLYKYVFQKDEYCILILGLDNAGKTVGAWSRRHPSEGLGGPHGIRTPLKAASQCPHRLLYGDPGRDVCRFGNQVGRVQPLPAWVRLSFQTFLEQSKTRFNKNYKGMSLSKITTTVGLNSKGVP